jgi:hypothetical protein
MPGSLQEKRCLMPSHLIAWLVAALILMAQAFALGEANYQKVKQEGLSFTKEVEVTPETARIRLLIYERNSGRLGSLTTPI